jgi:hypothetical protein
MSVIVAINKKGDKLKPIASLYEFHLISTADPQPQHQDTAFC